MTFAPYNFFPFSKVNVPQPYKTREDLPSHAEIRDGSLSGRIDYTLTALTPVAVGGIRDDQRNSYFSRDGEGRFIIPGSSVRGMVRSHAEMLSFSYPEQIDNTVYMYRRFAGRCVKLRKEYGAKLKASPASKIRVPDGVKAGWISCDQNGRYYFTPVESFGETGTTFFQIHEKDLRNAGLLSSNQCMYSSQINKFYTTSTSDRDIRRDLAAYNKDIKYKKNKYYKPYRKSNMVTFDYSDNRITNLGKGSFRGVVLNSAWMDGKTHHYLVSAKKLEEKRFEVERQQILDYRKDYERNCIQRKELVDQADFYALPGRGKEKLFFYKADRKGRLIGFGPTPYFRIFFDYPVKNGIRMRQGKGYDYVSSVFGYVGHGEEGAEAYKGRVSFADARLVSDDRNTTKKDLLLLSPRGTAVHMYLDQTGRTRENLFTYNDADMELRGYKYYWKRSQIPASDGKVDVMSHLETLPEGSVFHGEIYFENLTEDELGLLLLSLRINGNQVHESYMIGGGKPYGLGQVEPGNIHLYLLDKARRFTEPDLREEDATDQISSLKSRFTGTLKETYGIDSEKQNTWRIFRKVAEQRAADAYVQANGTVYMSLPEYAAYDPLPAAAEILNQYPSGIRKLPAGSNPPVVPPAREDVSRQQNEASMIWIARYGISPDQRSALKAAGIRGRYEHEREWVTEELLEKYAEEYRTVLLPGNTKDYLLRKADQLFDHVILSVKAGKTDSGWETRK